MGIAHITLGVKIKEGLLKEVVSRGKSGKKGEILKGARKRKKTPLL